MTIFDPSHKWKSRGLQIFRTNGEVLQAQCTHKLVHICLWRGCRMVDLGKHAALSVQCMGTKYELNTGGFCAVATHICPDSLLVRNCSMSKWLLYYKSHNTSWGVPLLMQRRWDRSHTLVTQSVICPVEWQDSPKPPSTPCSGVSICYIYIQFLPLFDIMYHSFLVCKSKGWKLT